MLDEVRERLGGHHRNLSHRHRLSSVGPRNEDAPTSEAGREGGGGESPTHRAKLAGERELADGEGSLQHLGVEELGGDEEAQGHGQVE